MLVVLCAPHGWAGERVMVDDRTGCLEGLDTAARLTAIADAGDPDSLLTVAVVVALAEDASLATLRVLVNHSGEVVLERTFPRDREARLWMVRSKSGESAQAGAETFFLNQTAGLEEFPPLVVRPGPAPKRNFL